MANIFVFGHRNPDNDSVSSAVAYAYLKNQTDPDNTYIPARLGPCPKETQWVFEKYGVGIPRALSHVRNRVADCMTAPVISVPVTKTLLSAGRTLSSKGFGALMVHEEDGRFAGMLSMRQLAELYLAETEVAGAKGTTMTLGDLAYSIEGSIATGDPDTVLSGCIRIAASEPGTVADTIEEGDTVVLGDRKRTQPVAIEAGAACVVLSCGAVPSQEVIELAREHGTAVLTSPLDTYAVARLATLAAPIGPYIEREVDTAKADDLLSEVAERVLPGSYREAAVLDDDGRCIGVLTRGDIARAAKRKVILVDHNEMSQSAVGIEDAEVVEIVDHHRVADVQTAGPILFMNYPLGSTATIITKRFRELFIAIPVPIAAVLLSAIMTDTMLLKSPTTTEVDRECAQHLGHILKTDPVQFGIEVLKSRGGDKDATPEQIVLTDAKVFQIGDLRVLVAQHETFEFESVLNREAELSAFMEQVAEQSGYDCVLLLLTDVIAEGSQFICIGKKQLVEKAFGISLAEGSVFMPGILSRKKQVVGTLFEHSV